MRVWLPIAGLMLGGCLEVPPLPQDASTTSGSTTTTSGGTGATTGSTGSSGPAGTSTGVEETAETTGPVGCDPNCSTGHCDEQGRCARYVFVLRTVVAGDFGGRDAGDQLCQADADTAGLPGQYRALLTLETEPVSEAFGRIAYDTIDASFVMPGASSGSLVAEDPQSLRGDVMPTSLLHPIDRDSNGTLVASNSTACGTGTAWTGARRSGDLVIPGTTCNEWTAGGVGEAGSMLAIDVGWLATGSVCMCNQAAHLYCFEMP